MSNSSIVVSPVDTPWEPPPDVLKINNDFIQQALLEAVKLGGKDNKGRPITRKWIFWRARRRKFDARKKNQLEERYRKSEEERNSIRRLQQSPLFRQIGDPLQAMIAKEITMNIRDALAKLTPEQVRAVLEKVHEGMPLSQISEELAIPLAAAKWKLTQGLRQLREKLAARGIFDDFREATR